MTASRIARALLWLWALFLFGAWLVAFVGGDAQSRYYEGFFRYRAIMGAIALAGSAALLAAWRWRAWAPVLLAGIGCAAAAAYSHHVFHFALPSPGEWLRRIALLGADVGIASLMLSALAAAGEGILAACRVTDRSGWRCVGTGAAAMVTLWFGLGQVDLYQPVVAWAVIAPLGAIGVVRFGPAAIRGLRRLAVRGRTLPPVALAALVPLVPALLYALIRAAAPITDDDSLRLHLELPRWYVIDGGMTPHLEKFYGMFPAAYRMLHVPVLLMKDEAPTQWLGMFFFLGTVLLLYRWARRHLSVEWSCLAVSLYASLSLNRIYLGTAKAELLAGLAAMLAWMELRRADEEGGWAPWVLAGLFMGLVASSKPFGLLFPAVVAGVELLVAAARRDGPRVRRAVVMGLCGAALAVPWLVRSYAVTGDPVWPFGYRWFHGTGWSDSAEARFQAGAAAYYPAPRSALNMLAFPWHASFSQPPLETNLEPYFLALLPLALLLRRARELNRVLLSAGIAWCILYFLWLLPRWFLFFWPPLTAIAVTGVAALPSRFMRMALAAGIAGVVWGTAAVHYPAIEDAPGAAARIEDRDSYLARASLAYPILQAANRLVPEGEEVLRMVDGGSYYMNRPYRWSWQMRQAEIDYEALGTADALAAKVRELGIEYGISFVPDRMELEIEREFLHDHVESLETWHEYMLWRLRE